MIPNAYSRDQAGDAAPLVEGYYLIKRWRQRRVPLPVRIWYGAPLDPETGEPLDRSPRWQIQIAGIDIDGDEIRVGTVTYTSISDFWPACSDHPIDESDYLYRIARAEWAGQFDPYDPFGDTAARIDPMTATLPFMENCNAAC